jgi:hypothetical protein
MTCLCDTYNGGIWPGSNHVQIESLAQTEMNWIEKATFATDLIVQLVLQLPLGCLVTRSLYCTILQYNKTIDLPLLTRALAENLMGENTPERGLGLCSSFATSSSNAWQFSQVNKCARQ